MSESWVFESCVCVCVCVCVCARARARVCVCEREREKRGGQVSVYTTLISLVFTVYYSLNCYMFRSYDNLHAEIYLLEITLLTTDLLFLRY
jgi:hypothetical protein